MINSPVRLLARSAWIAAWFSERKASLESHRLRAGFCHSPQITQFSYLVLTSRFFVRLPVYRRNSGQVGQSALNRSTGSMLRSARSGS
jgi:hypothetical protein